MAAKPERTTSVNGSPRNYNMVALQDFIDNHPSIEFLRFQALDYCGIIKARILSVAAALRLVANGGSISTLNAYLVANHPDGSLYFPAITSAKDELVPDWTSLVVCHYEPTHAVVMCLWNEAGMGFETCPRSLLMEMEKAAKEKHNLSILVGSEVEFYICDWANGEPTPHLGGLLPFGLSGFRDVCLTIVEESVKILEKAGIQVCQFHAEGGGAGIFELSTEPLSPVKAIDALIYTHETLKTVAAKHKLHITIHPKPFEKSSGTGAHMHISISEDEFADSFLAGMLANLPAIVAFGMPNFDSYDRQLIAGGDFVTWGDENRLCPIRRITKAHWEIRCLDGAANMYLAVGALLCAGLGGVLRADELTIKGRKLLAPTIDDAEMKELNITTRMPTSLKQSLEALQRNEWLRNALGARLVKHYIGNKLQEESRSSNMSSLERRRTFARAF
jgi:glutamine synthetase